MSRALLIVMTLMPLSVAFSSNAIRAGEPDTTAARQRADCRYDAGTGAPGVEGTMVRVLLPQQDLFRPLMADMKQPRFYMSYRRVSFRGSALPAEQQGNSINAGVEMKSLIGPQRFRFLLVYLRGFVPFGQFFNTEKIDNFGMEIQLDI